jgi:C4-type Zn-finger protein
VTGVVKAATLTANSTNVTLKLSTNFQAVVPAAKKGDKITMTIKDPKGKSYSAPVVTVAKAGSVKLPSVKFSVAGKYTITIKVGTKTKTVTLTATK